MENEHPHRFLRGRTSSPVYYLSREFVRSPPHRGIQKYTDDPDIREAISGS